MTELPKPWAGLGYQPVPGLANRYIARYLRGRRKFMRRFFTERGLLDLTDRMDQIKKSRQGMLAKNRMFQKVLDDYAQIVNPLPTTSGTSPTSAAEAAHLEVPAGGVAVQTTGRSDASGMEPNDGPRPDAAPGVREVAATDSNEPVIEE